MSKYMVEAQEEKTKAIKAAELASSSKDAENVRLKAELTKYQDFMAKYIVESQEQKVKAIKAAEMATAKKYEEKLLLAGVPTQETPVTLYQSRNKKVSEAAKAGKSRWGDAEIKIVNESLGKAPPMAGADTNGASVTQSAAPATLNPAQELYHKRNVAVAEAGKAGKSRWGDMEVSKASQEASKPVLATAASPPAVSTSPGELASPAALSANQELFHKRSVAVAAAGKAGKSRWGEMEVDKAAEVASKPVLASVSSTVSVTPEIEAADHGLRSQDAVGGATLAERVNLGVELFERAAAAAASATNIEITPEIEAADHGLRSQDAVGGATLAERVNLGAQLLK